MSSGEQAAAQLRGVISVRVTLASLIQARDATSGHCPLLLRAVTSVLCVSPFAPGSLVISAAALTEWHWCVGIEG